MHNFRSQKLNLIKHLIYDIAFVFLFFWNFTSMKDIIKHAIQQ